jgi:dephospho-CoA kinase
VDAAESVRLRRLVEQRGLTEAEALAMIRAQMPASAKRSGSDYVIDNDADLATLERAASEVWRALVARA